MGMKINAVDHPALVDTVSLVVVVAHALLTLADAIPPVWAPLIAAEVANQVSLYLAFFGAAALVSSFAGVVIVFGITPQTLRFQRFRVRAGESLSRQWTWTSGAGFASAGLGLAAGISALSGGGWLAPWLFEFAIFLVAHSAVRLVLILRALVRIVRRDDVEAVKAAGDTPKEKAPWRR
jgi:hypothetical protein